MKRIVTGILMVLMLSIGIIAILGSGGTSERANRQWVNNSVHTETQCKDWCTNQLRNHNCVSATYTWGQGICSCDGVSCD